MIIKVKDLRANPFRKLAQYTINPEKVKNLKISMEKTGFWDNVLVRECPTEKGVYEISYGHHRLTALQELEIEEIDAPVKDLSDNDMLRIMADENFEYGARDPKTVNETISAVKDHIEEHISEKNAVYEDLDDWCKELFEGSAGFNHTVKSNLVGQNPNQIGIGRNILHKYLGSNWSIDTIRFSLSMLSPAKPQERTFPSPTVPEEDAVEDHTEETTKDATNETPVVPEKPSAPQETKTYETNFYVNREACELFKDMGHVRAFIETLRRDDNCKAVFPTMASQLKLVKELLEENEEITSSLIKNEVKRKAQNLVDGSEHITPPENPLVKIMRASKSKKITAEVKRVYKRLKNLPDYLQQTVLTEKMAQGLLNDMYEMEYFIQHYRLRLQNDLKLEPNKECIAYNNYPSVVNFEVEDSKDLSKIDTDIEEIDYETELDDDAEDFINAWIQGRNESVDEID